jgi:Ser/Thr protein kinase RdoA (MazF antagonist)
MLHNIIKNFFPYSAVTEVKPFGNGHINTTYKLDLRDEKKSYILQRINTDVFKDPQGICDTHNRLQDEIFKGQHPITIAQLIPTADGKKLFTDHEGGVWRMTSFIEDSYTIDVVEEDWQAFEAGNAFGWFAKACDKLNANTFKESIKDFHRLSFRLRQLNEAIEADKAGRLESIKDIVKFYKDREASVSAIEALVDEGKIPLRVVHNDTKINNLLFRDKQAAAVIDLDTVGPGILYYDYGDALRTSASTAPEDEKDLSKVHFNIDAFKAFTSGYISQVKTIVSDDEEELFYMAPMLMTYIMGIRFLADYINGDVYYKVAHKEHNIDRSKVQKKLIESMEQQVEEMKQIITEALKAIPV